jgi:hypothetical protein
MMRPLITLTTDFGSRDAYVGAMKGVMLGIEPQAQFVDITHAIPPQDVRHTAYVLWSALPYFLESTVHLIVVDPGVGTTRRAIASQTPWGWVVGPDNGVFSYVWASAPPSGIVSLNNPRYHRGEISRTFHGRDIFAPAAAHLAAGVALENLGDAIDDPVRLPTPTFAVGSDRIQGEVIAVDHFGNVVTSIGQFNWVDDRLTLDAVFGDVDGLTLNTSRSRVFAGGRAIGPIRSTYGGVARGESLALIGSTGMLEVAVNQGHGATVLGLGVGDPVEIRIGA